MVLPIAAADASSNHLPYLTVLLRGNCTCDVHVVDSERKVHEE